MATTSKIPYSVTTFHVSIIVAIAFAYVAWWLFKVTYGTYIPKTKGIPELPRSIAFFGHLKFLGADHASGFQDA